jgi:XTP/dITP diphosphohydrolase
MADDELSMILASCNRGKYAEFSDFFTKRAAFSASRIKLIFAGEAGGVFNGPDDVEETGDSYEINALIKARAWADSTGLPAIADDSGLEVRSLGWRPGIYSARAAAGDDNDRIAWLLRELDGMPDRRACFAACIVVAFPSAIMSNSAGRSHFVSEGRCWGKITRFPAGSDGFGYDPIFLPDGHNKTFAELGRAVKSKISHRAIAMRGVAQMLPAVLKYFALRKEKAKNFYHQKEAH